MITPEEAEHEQNGKKETARRKLKRVLMKRI
jgi:hypothetical protein